MSNIPLGHDLKQLFDDVTTGKSEPPARAILVQNVNGTLRLMNSLPAEGNDKEDFTTVLGKLFASEPSKPGYALFRLDSKSPAGLYEWLNCAFRPEGAKVREKMQYAVTQASLFKGLNEQHFLETVYGSTTMDFAFPTRLRNARKHDYQNPQQQTKGKPAAEAAGADAGGARRNFEAINAVARAASATTASKSEEQEQTSAVDVEESSEIQAHDVKQLTPAADLDPVAPPARESNIEKDAALTTEGPTESGPEQNSKLEPTDEDGQVTKKEESHTKSDSEAVVASEEKSIQPQATAAPPAEAEQTEEVGLVEIAQAKGVAPPAERHEESGASFNSAPLPSFDIPASNATAAGLAAEVDIIPQSNGAAKAAITKEDPAKITAAATPVVVEEPKVATSSIGVGKGAEGLETERERHLASIKAEESQNRSSGPRPGGPRTGFQWKADVEPAVARLAGEEINLVVLKLDLGEEEVQLAREPSHVAPEEVASTLANIGTDEPLYALYAHPQALVAAERSVGLIYACPSQSTVRQRMLYSLNMTMLSKLVNAFDGISLDKRAETSDVSDLTADYLQATFADGESGGDEAPSAAKLSRPKRPGRK